MIIFVFSSSAKKAFENLPIDTKNRIKNKLRFLKTHPNFLSNCSPLYNFEPATHRLRIGDHRLILEQKSKKEFLILDIGHRREIYK